MAADRHVIGGRSIMPGMEQLITLAIEIVAGIGLALLELLH